MNTNRMMHLNITDLINDKMVFDERRCYLDWLPAELIVALREVLTWDDKHKAMAVQFVINGHLNG